MRRKLGSVLLLWKNMAKSLLKNQLEIFSIATIMLLVILILVGLTGVTVFLNKNKEETYKKGNHNQIVFNYSAQDSSDIYPDRSSPMFLVNIPTSAKDKWEAGADNDTILNREIIGSLLKAEWKAGINTHASFRNDRVLQNSNSNDLYKIIGIPYWCQANTNFQNAKMPVTNSIGLSKDLLGNAYYNGEWNYLKTFLSNSFKGNNGDIIPPEWANMGDKLAGNLLTIPNYNSNGKGTITQPILIDSAKDPSNIKSDPGKSHWPYGPHQILISKRYAKTHNINIFNFKDKSGKFLDMYSTSSKLTFSDVYNLANKQHAVKVIDDVRYIVTGYAINSDFIYPQFSETNLTPNNDDQCLVFTASDTFSRNFMSHFSVSPTSCEQSIQLFVSSAPTSIDQNSLLNGVAASDDSAILKKAVKIAKNVASEFTEKSKGESLYNADLVTNFPDMLSQRYTFTDTLSNILKVVSVIFVSLISLVSIFILSIIIKKQVDYDAKKIGILKSLGYKATTISTMYVVTPFIVSLFSSIIGLGIGIFSWLILINIFERYFNFYIQKKDSISVIISNNPIFIAISMIAPLSFIILFSLFITIRLVRRDTKELIYETDN